MADYHLYKILKHSNPIRNLVHTSHGDLLTCSQNGELFLWRKEKDFNLCETLAFRPHEKKNLVLAFDLVGKEGDADLFISGSSDKTAKVWKADGSVLHTLRGHEATVNSVAVLGGNRFLTGSFDRTAKVWSGQTCTVTLKGDNLYGVDVCHLSSKEIITSSFKNISIYDENTKLVRFIKDAHDDSIRKIIPHPMGFASCSNDGKVKVWTKTGDFLFEILAHPSVSETPSFVYSLAMVPQTGEMVSVGEDARCCVWDGTRLVQEIKMPQYIREVRLLNDGDIAATNGEFVFIFSRSDDRKAGGDLLVAFEGLFGKKKDYNVEASLPTTGQFDGENKIVREAEGDVVYIWGEAKQTWEKLGVVCSKEQPTGKAELDGKFYDHIVHIEYDGANEIRLGINKDDDPELIAEKFCGVHMLDSTQKKRIAEHLEQFIDKAALQKRLQLEKERRRSQFKTLPIWEKGLYQMAFKANVDAMARKILETNEKLKDEKNNFCFGSEKETTQLQNLLALIRNTSKFHSTHFTAGNAKTLEKLLNWPHAVIFPVLDAVRILTGHDDFLKQFEKNIDCTDALLKTSEYFDYLPSALLCKIFANFIAKKRKTITLTPVETKIASAISSFALSQWASASAYPAQPTRHKHRQTFLNSLASLIFNLLLWTGPLHSEQSLAISKSLFPLFLSLRPLLPPKAASNCKAAMASIFLKLASSETASVSAQMAASICSNDAGLIDPEPLASDLKALFQSKS